MLEKENRTLGWPARLVISSILLLSPLIVVFLLGAGLVVAAFWFVVLMLMMCVAMLWTLLARRRERAQELELAEEPTRVLEEGEQPEAVRQVMDVELAIEQGEVQVFHGTLRTPAAAVYQRLKRAFFFERTVPMVQEDQQHDAAIVLVHSASPQAALERPVRPLVHWCLFALTVLTTIWAGAAQQGVNLLREPERFAAGLPYAIGLLGILGVHELGHYFAARWHGMRVTPPFFIPVPFGLGTFGAFIQMRSPAEDRRALFDVAVAGPLAGLAIAVPALWLGLQTSTVVEGDPTGDTGAPRGVAGGASLLVALLSKLSHGDALESAYGLRLSPLAFAGWLGLLITALNLLPIGQLDGGHIARAMFGSRLGNQISSVAMWSLLVFAILASPGLLTWALVAFFLAGPTMPPLNDLTPLDRSRRWLGYASVRHTRDHLDAPVTLRRTSRPVRGQLMSRAVSDRTAPNSHARRRLGAFGSFLQPLKNGVRRRLIEKRRNEFAPAGS